VIDATDRNSLQGNLRIHEASTQGRVGVLENLFLSEPDLEAVDDHGLTALHKAASIPSSSQVAIMNLLIAKGAKVDSTDDLGATPLHHAAWQGCDEAASLLLLYDTSPSEPDNAGWTPLQLVPYTALR
jgi:ankyrin repeat protein